MEMLICWFVDLVREYYHDKFQYYFGPWLYLLGSLAPHADFGAAEPVELPLGSLSPQFRFLDSVKWTSDDLIWTADDCDAADCGGPCG